MTRTEAMRACAGVLVRSVADLDGLLMLLCDAGMTRLAAAVEQAKTPISGLKGRFPADGSGELDLALWNEAAERMTGGGR